jgi:hypothetical protein
MRGKTGAMFRTGSEEGPALAVVSGMPAASAKWGVSHAEYWALAGKTNKRATTAIKESESLMNIWKRLRIL